MFLNVLFTTVLDVGKFKHEKYQFLPFSEWWRIQNCVYDYFDHFKNVCTCIYLTIMSVYKKKKTLNQNKPNV